MQMCVSVFVSRIRQKKNNTQLIKWIMFFQHPFVFNHFSDFHPKKNIYIYVPHAYVGMHFEMVIDFFYDLNNCEGIFTTTEKKSLLFVQYVLFTDEFNGSGLYCSFLDHFVINLLHCTNNNKKHIQFQKGQFPLLSKTIQSF